MIVHPRFSRAQDGGGSGGGESVEGHKFIKFACLKQKNGKTRCMICVM